ncbi:MAG: glycosyltransferase family 2 protein, partial [Phycisphaeraceae bacterium]
MLTAAILFFLLAAAPAGVFVWNLRYYRPLPEPGELAGELPAVSVLIPARNEAGRIGPTLDALLASRGVRYEVIVLDDASEDGTAEVVAERARGDERLRLERSRPLPAGWNGKQHACWQLAGMARYELLVFLDADVRVLPGALRRIAGAAARRRAGLISGFPREQAVRLGERLLVPLIHFVLLGYLPMGRMRRSRSPAYAAGCGQLMVAWREAYFAAGGHGAIRASRHDGLALPRAFREAGQVTDLFDGDDLGVCRMYEGLGETWRGLAKNATEGLGSPGLILPSSLLLLGG